MAVENFLMAAVREFNHRNYLPSMACACIALDGTAQNEIGGNHKDRCLRFLDSNIDIICKVGFGGVIMTVPGGSFSLMNPKKPNETQDLKLIIYEAIRCALLHEADLPAGVIFTEEVHFGGSESQFYIPISLIPALFLATIGSPVNKGKNVDATCEFRWDGGIIRINEVMGDSSAIRKLLKI